MITRVIYIDAFTNITIYTMTLYNTHLYRSDGHLKGYSQTSAINSETLYTYEPSNLNTILVDISIEQHRPMTQLL